MIRSGKFKDKKILLIDREPKTKNDRTWCFWEAGDGFFEPIVYRKWPRVDFMSDAYSATLEITPYEYKMIRGIDFYNYCFREISAQANIEVVYGDIGSCCQHREGIFIEINKIRYTLDHAIVFNSIYTKNENTGISLLQHFKGWVIETGNDVFDPGKASLMDFRVHQQHGTTFAYVLPFSPRSALVEYTLFTPQLLEPEQYDLELRNYISQFLGLTSYTIKEQEFGVIPMTNEKFTNYRDGVFHIGTAGGQTKASSGYTFQFIQKQSDKIMEYLPSGAGLSILPDTPKRFRFYDNTLLHILYYNKLPGRDIFTRLFRKNKPQQVLKFLDNESTLREELGIISTLPTWPFLKAAVQSLVNSR
jgi:lycopene beta-cyclase